MEQNKIVEICENILRMLIEKYGLPSAIKDSPENMSFLYRCVLMSVLYTEEILTNPELEKTK